MTSPFLIKNHGFQQGYSLIASQDNSALRWITVGRLGLLPETAYEGATDNQELVINVLSGSMTFECDGIAPVQVGGRQDVFSNGPAFLCIPPSVRYQLTASPTTPVEAIFFHAPATTGIAPNIIWPVDAPPKTVGASNWSRSVWPGTGTSQSTQRLIVGETINPPGNWSSYPPHKHDTDDLPREAVYEEVYVFAVKPVGGFGIQRIYERSNAEDALDELIVVEDGDTVIIPRGYHPVVAAPGYQLGYCWALCGHGRTYGAWSDDPAHAWIRHVEPIITSQT